MNNSAVLNLAIIAAAFDSGFDRDLESISEDEFSEIQSIAKTHLKWVGLEVEVTEEMVSEALNVSIQ